MTRSPWKQPVIAIYASSRVYQKYVVRLRENSDVWFQDLKVEGWSEKSSHSEPLVSL